MCGRYTLHKEIEEIEHFLGVLEKYGEFRPNYNVAPTHEMPVCFQDENGNRILDSMHWGFVGWKPKPGSKGFFPINTREDALTTKPMWTNAFTQRRCIVPANGFYEWAGSKGNKTPHYMRPKDEDFFGFAGIYSELAPEDKAASRSYSIITTSPNKVMEKIHDRMPVILHPEEFNAWLNPGHEDPNYLMDFLKPYPDDAMEEYIVSKACGNVRNNDPALIEKADLFG